MISYRDKVSSLRHIAASFGLPELKPGFPGLYMRIWSWDYGENRYVIDIKRCRTENQCSIISFVPSGRDTNHLITIHKRFTVKPISGWDTFFNSLKNYNIPQMNGVEFVGRNKTDMTGLEFVEFEIAERYQYRYYEFLEPYYFKNTDSVSAKICQFFTYFNREMKTQIYKINSVTKDSILAK